MGFRPFTSESYAEHDRLDAWRDVLSTAGLAPLSGAGDDALPIALLPTEDGVVLHHSGHQIVPAGHLLVLPPHGDWTLFFQRDLRAIGLYVTGEAFHGRKTGAVGWIEPRAMAPQGLAGIVARALASAVQSLDALSEPEWDAVAQGLADLLFTLTRQMAAPVRDGGSSTKAAIMNRVCQTIERGLEDPDLTPARVAQSEGISERYLQKLFEGVGDNFSHYVRERRLQRAWADLANPAEGNHTISEIAYRYGFGDSAHFSRTFRARFGLSPREFRQQEAERNATSTIAAGHRGWPQDALAQLRQQRTIAASSELAPLPAANDDAEVATEPTHHHLAIKAERIHWGYFSRSL